MRRIEDYQGGGLKRTKEENDKRGSRRRMIKGDQGLRIEEEEDQGRG